MTKKIEILKKTLEDFYLKRKLSSYKIAKIYGCNPSAIQKRLKKHKIPLIHKKNEIKISKNKLQELYTKKKLSTYQIAKLYSCKNNTIHRKLKLSGIATRPKKVIPLSKERLKILYEKRRLSAAQIAKKYNCTSSVILDKLGKYQIKIRDASEANTIYSKKHFEGDTLKKAYMIGFRLGDLYANIESENSKTIKISSSTTKKAQVELIKKVFGCYGHFYVWKKENICSVSCQLHESFSFLLPKKDDVPPWILQDNYNFFSFLAGYTDAEGCIKISQGRARYRVGSYDKKLLEKVHLKLEKLMLCPKYNLETKKGTIYGGKIQNGDFWRVSVNNKYALLKLLQLLEPYMHHGDKLEDLKRAKSNILERNRKFGMKGTKKDDYEKILRHYPDLLHQ